MGGSDFLFLISAAPCFAATPLATTGTSSAFAVDAAAVFVVPASAYTAPAWPAAAAAVSTRARFVSAEFKP